MNCHHLVATLKAYRSSTHGWKRRFKKRPFSALIWPNNEFYGSGTCVFISAESITGMPRLSHADATFAESTFGGKARSGR
jgi:hypothetical protein